jgi:ATP-dependent DNA helicase RecG
MIENLIPEASECDFKESLEIRKPKDWLKTVSAFANGIGGTIFFGIADDRTEKGLSDIQKDGEAISRFIKERLTPIPEFVLTPYRTIGGKDILALSVPGGDNPPYFYNADGSMMAYVRIGNESNPASSHRLKELVMRGKNITFDSLSTEYRQTELEFSIFETAYKKITGKAVSPKDYVSFRLSQPDGVLTYAGAYVRRRLPVASIPRVLYKVERSCERLCLRRCPGRQGVRGRPHHASQKQP